MKILALIVVFLIGGFFGSLVTALCVAAGRYRDACDIEIIGDGWISVDEKTPGPYETVLISILSKNGYGEPATLETVGFFECGDWHSCSGPILDGERVTHWMPMPAAPEARP